MADGVVLRADVYRPATSEPVPALLGWSPYNKDLMPTGLPAPFVEPGAVAYLASRGYGVAVVNARGTGRSGGQLGAVMFDEVERADLGATIEWFAARPWCNGQVGMTGMSYFAISQLVAAAERFPALRAIFPFGASTDLDRHGVTHNGTLQSGFLGRYTVVNGAAQRLRLPPAARHALGYVLGSAPVRRVVRGVMTRALPRVVRRAPAPRPWLDRWDEYALEWRRHPAPELERVDVPVLIGTEWSMVGIHLFGAFDAWHRIRAPRKLLVGPRWPHWPWLRYQDELVAFYDHVLKSRDNGYAELPRCGTGCMARSAGSPHRTGRRRTHARGRFGSRAPRSAPRRARTSGRGRRYRSAWSTRVRTTATAGRCCATTRRRCSPTCTWPARSSWCCRCAAPHWTLTSRPGCP
jgi:putative CocE/NonD family hydrolase